MKSTTKNCFAIIFVLLAASFVNANDDALAINNITGINKERIESILVAPASELELKTAIEIKQMMASAAATPEALNAARPVCYSSLITNNNHAIIMVPLPSNLTDLDALCHVTIGPKWHAGGVAKAYNFNQNCGSLDNSYYGGGYTSYVTENFFESHRSKYSNCGPTNAMVCCSPQHSN